MKIYSVKMQDTQLAHVVEAYTYKPFHFLYGPRIHSHRFSWVFSLHTCEARLKKNY